MDSCLTLFTGNSDYLQHFTIAGWFLVRATPVLPQLRKKILFADTFQKKYYFSNIKPKLVMRTIFIYLSLFISTGIMAKEMEKATLAGGCFWCTEAVYLQLKGVTEVKPGYSGGFVKNPSYEEVCNGTTGHAEAVQILYDPETVSFAEILEVFFMTHDPTTLNRQGNDVGTQYRSAAFYSSEEQKAAIAEAIREYEKSHPGKRVVTESVKTGPFFAAEEYHQDYLEKNPGGYCHVDLDLLREPLE